MIIASIVDNNLIELLKQFNLFERNKIPLEIKLTAIAMYILSSSLRRIATLLNVGKSTIHYWVKIQRRAQREKGNKEARNSPNSSR